MIRGLREWIDRHQQDLSLVTMVVGLVAFGYCLGAINYQQMISANRVQHAADVQQLAEAYRAALASKDETISALSRRTVQAAVTANKAAATAQNAAKTAQKAVEGKQ
jgi:hypothetical protein